MMKRIVIIAALIALTAFRGTGQETGIRREITLYNPFRPSLPDVVKKSFLPEMNDTSRVTPVITYNVKTTPFTPPYTVSPLRPATMVPDPLNKLYNSYLRAGFGNYLTPLGELSITNQRSKKGMAGFYAGHYSTGGKVNLGNDQKVFAGYMDNNAMLYGSRFLRASILYGSADISQNVRYAYGRDTSFQDYDPSKKEIRMNYFTAGAVAGIRSAVRDSSEVSYKAEIGYNFFSSRPGMFENSFNISAAASKMIKDFYAGSELEFILNKPAGDISPSNSWTVALSPYVKKKTEDWDFKLGASVLLDRELNQEVKPRIYPDLRFAFNILPSYLGFYAELTGKLHRNRPASVIEMNPFILPDTLLYMVRSTRSPIIVSAGFTGETGLDGYYRVYASYSVTDNLLLFSNYAAFDAVQVYSGGNYFRPLYDEAEILGVSAETAGRINSYLGFDAGASWFRYTLTTNQAAWGMPDWKARLNMVYKLRDKITGTLGMNATGSRKALQTTDDLDALLTTDRELILPANLTFNLGAEYRFTKILSFWLKLNNVAFSKNYEWALYPSQRFNLLAGFTYSL